MSAKSSCLIILWFFHTLFSIGQTDGCGAASTLLTPGAAGAACSAVAGSTATGFTDSNQGCAAGTEDDDGWYRFVATATSHTITVDGAANMDAVLGVYNTCGGAQPTGGTCVDATADNGIETRTITGLTVGNTYFISIHDWNSGGGNFTVCVTTPAAALANDDCGGAITVTCGNTYSGSTGSATSASDPSALCGVTPGSDGVWYVFAGNGNSITASLCGSAYDTEINVYSGSCAALSCVGGNDDFCGSSSQLTFTSTLGVNYYILVNGYGGASGNFTLAITCAAPPSATAQDCGGGSTICSNTSFSGNSSGGGNINDFTAGNTDCLDPPEHQTSWYYFSSTTNGTIGMTITPALTTDDYDWAIWGPLAAVSCPPGAAPIRCSAADGNGTPANITGLGNGAADATEGPTGNGWVSSLNVLAGQIYILVLDNWTSSNSPFTLSWQLSNGANLNCTPLPIELISFTGKNEGSKIKLEWITASEHNNDYFTIERSDDGLSFETIITKDSKGNSSGMTNYESYDLSPSNGKIYYRLKQTDNDGKYTYSSIIIVEKTQDQTAVTNVHPNPTADDLNFDFYCSAKGIVKIQITDITGRVIISEEQKVEEGRSSLNTRMENLTRGIYSLNVEFGEGHFRSVTKVVKY
jgi:hypothetical protein